MNRKYGKLIFLPVIAFYCLPVILPGAEMLLDSFSYRSNAAARSRWREKEATPPVRPAADGGLFFDCPFASLPVDRFYWDRDMTLDLSDYFVFKLDLECSNPEAMRSLAVYFRSGDGWYIWNRPLSQTGRKTLYLAREDFSTEGAPDGWDRIEGVRISPWRGSRGIDTRLRLYELRALRPRVLLIRGSASVPNENEGAVAVRVTRYLARRLSALGISHAVIDENDLTPDVLAGARVVLLGYNPVLPETLYGHIDAFLERGGKALVFYSADTRLARRMGFVLEPYQAARMPMQWSAFSFPDAEAWKVPPRVLQHSWNLRPVRPARSDAEIIAWWENAAGVRSSEPAWAASRNGAWMTHILLDGDNIAKENMLAGLLTRWAPELWPGIAETVIEDAGRLGSYGSLRETISALEGKITGLAPERQRAVTGKIRSAAQSHARAQRTFHAGSHQQAFSLARTARRQLVEAMALALPSQDGEWRGIWDHHALGWYPGDWNRTASELRDAGINMIFPNVAWAGLAHYASDILPRSQASENLGDQMADALRASRDNGLQLHAWIVCWKLGGTPAAFRERMQRENRLQKDADGRTLNWLCPANADNQLHMLAIIREIASYKPHGIHLDYIRFPGRNACFCDTCRRNIEGMSGRKITDWPAAAQEGGSAANAAYKHRAETITAFVRRARQVVGEIDRDMEFSAAVFGAYPGSVKSVGQDWGAWLRAGLLDFVAPMNYTDNTARFGQLIRRQQAGPAAGSRILPGIGASSNEAPLSSDRVLEQIAQTRLLETSGYIIFALDLEFREQIMPLLRMQQGDGRVTSRQRFACVAGRNP